MLYNIGLIEIPVVHTDNRGVYHLLEHVLLQGSTRLDMSVCHSDFKFERDGAFVSGCTLADKLVLYAVTDQPNVRDEMVEYLENCLASPRLLQLPTDTSGFGRVRAAVVHEMLFEARSLKHVRRKWVNSILFPGSGLGFASGGEPAEIETVTAAECAEAHARLLLSARITVRVRDRALLHRKLETSDLGHQTNLCPILLSSSCADRSSPPDLVIVWKVGYLSRRTEQGLIKSAGVRIRRLRRMGEVSLDCWYHGAYLILLVGRLPPLEVIQVNETLSLIRRDLPDLIGRRESHYIDVGDCQNGYALEDQRDIVRVLRAIMYRKEEIEFITGGLIM